MDVEVAGGGDAAGASDDSGFLDLLDWRRRVAELYTAVRRDANPQAAWRLWRATRDTLFASHPQTPLAADAQTRFSGIAYFDYDPAFRFEVTLQGMPEREQQISLTGRGGTLALTAFAVTRGLEERLGKELSIYWISGYGGGVFLPFLDATSGDTTYGGGRYLLDSIKGADLGHTKEGALILDFNFAYNPSCSYSDRWACPLASPQSRVPAAIQAGERMTGLA